jgi:hypothetical protein
MGELAWFIRVCRSGGASMAHPNESLTYIEKYIFTKFTDWDGKWDVSGRVRETPLPYTSDS